MWLARKAPALSPCLFFQCSRLALTSRIPTVIWVGRKSLSGVAWKIGSRAHGCLPQMLWGGPLLTPRRGRPRRPPPKMGGAPPSQPGGRAPPAHPRLKDHKRARRRGCPEQVRARDLRSLLLGGGAFRVEALDVAALGAGGRVYDGVDQRRLSARERLG